MTDQTESGGRAESEERLAGLHLRVGALLLARAELESLAARAAITGPALADLAEARWRTGDLEHAAEAAAAHLASGGEQPIAVLILAEAETAAGHPDEALGHLAALEGISHIELAALLAGMPHQANWPSLSPGGIEPQPDASPRRTISGAPRSAAPGSLVSTNDASPGGRLRKRPSRAAFPDPGDLLRQARDDLVSGEQERMTAAFNRLGLVLRLNPAIAKQVVDLVARRQEPAALLVRGDAMRILGRALDAEAAYASAASALDKLARRTS